MSTESWTKKKKQFVSSLVFLVYQSWRGEKKRRFSERSAPRVKTSTTQRENFLDTGIKTYFFQRTAVCFSAELLPFSTLLSEYPHLTVSGSNFPCQAAVAPTVVRPPPACVYTRSYSVEATLSAAAVALKNNHDVRKGLSHWLEGVSRGPAPPIDNARCRDNHHPEDSESRGGLWDEVMQRRERKRGALWDDVLFLNIWLPALLSVAGRSSYAGPLSYY